MQLKLILVSIFVAFLTHSGWTQDSISTIDKIVNFPSSFFVRVNNKTANLEARLTPANRQIPAKTKHNDHTKHIP